MTHIDSFVETQTIPLDEAIFHHHTLKNAILNSMPEILGSTEKAKIIRRDISFYLFKQKKLKSNSLRKVLPVALFEILYEYKKLLRTTNGRVIEHLFAESSRQYDRWLRLTILEEE